MRLGFQVSSLKPLLTSGKGVADAFVELRKIGYRTLQIQWIDPSVPDEEVRDALLQTGLVCVSTQDYFERVEADLDRVIRQNQLWGSKLVTVSGIPKECFTAEGMRPFLKRLLRLYARLADEGLALTFHPRAMEFEPLGGMPAIDQVMDALPYDAQITLDLFHVEKAGLDLCGTVRRFAGRMDMVHFKNAAPGGEELAPVGKGDIDWAPVAAMCKKAGVKWGFVEQETWKGDPFEAMRESFSYMNGLGVR